MPEACPLPPLCRRIGDIGMRLRYRLAIQMLVYWLPVALGLYVIVTAASVTLLLTLFLLIVAGLLLIWLYCWAILRVRRDMKLNRDRVRRIREIQGNSDQFWKEPPR